MFRFLFNFNLLELGYVVHIVTRIGCPPEIFQWQSRRDKTLQCLLITVITFKLVECFAVMRLPALVVKRETIILWGKA